MKVRINHDGLELEAILRIPKNSTGLVIFAHGSGSSRLSPRNNFVAQWLNTQGIATLLADLLTPEEDTDYQKRFDIELLTKRLLNTTQWAEHEQSVSNLAVGYFGASTGGAAALQAAAKLGKKIIAVVSRGGRPDLAPDIAKVTAATLLIVGGNDYGVIELNEAALKSLTGPKDMATVPGATHLFEEPGALEQVADLAAKWFKKYF
ncbi:dienelactone hydrolase family protein [Candidatus Saccharibacteria bacterium]|nr:dienelactone hydrolase family protein [Candidatus Saccharibacteria bacterium]